MWKCQKVETHHANVAFHSCISISLGRKTRQVTFKCDWSLERSPRQPLASCHSSPSCLIAESCMHFFTFSLTQLIFSTWVLWCNVFSKDFKRHTSPTVLSTVQPVLLPKWWSIEMINLHNGALNWAHHTHLSAACYHGGLTKNGNCILLAGVSLQAEAFGWCIKAPATE